ncbi:hypothetical protein [Aridibaculum aurantiacum]|uniref:hypothetical protein n=1 Tax=Aridibaculum aurantiacum TaxID=2810307 RepID=UPI001A96DF77|nr:hypothetical protein [Aridibaculum aurantiacum]
MKRYLTLLAAIFFTVCANAQTKVTVQDASKHIGDTVKICDKVVSGSFMQTAEGRPTYLVLGNQPEAQVTLLIKGESRRRFDYKPEKDLLNRHICIAGKLESVDGKLLIVVNRQDEINIINSP